MPETAPVTWGKIARRIRVPAGFAFTAVYLWLARPTAQSLLIGMAFISSGIVIRALASGQLSKNEQLATGGLYAYTRNPLYLGSLILGLGFTVAARSWWTTVIIGILFTAIYVPVIKSEEEYLRTRFPQFNDYSRAVPRFIPRFISLRPYDHQFSWPLYLKHREYNAALGAAALIAALIAKVLWIK